MKKSNGIYVRCKTLKTVAVIGGGITGLTTVYYLQKLAKENQLDIRLILIEGNEYLGGKIKTAYEDDFMMETGADSIVTRKPNVASFIEELQLQDEVVHNATGKSFLHTDNQLKLIPEDSIFGIPLTIESLAKSDLVSAEGKVEALKDFYTENHTFTRNDSVGEFLEHFLGKELVDKQISPVLSGVYSGQVHDLTIASTLPFLLDYKNEYGSIIKGLTENRSLYQKNGESKFLSFKNGMSGLIDRIEEHLMDVQILKGIKAEKLEKERDLYRITLANQEVVEADFVVLATVHTTAQSLLQDEQLHVEFNQLRNNSLISVYFGFNLPDSLLPENGTGFITAEGSSLICNACTWTSRKWDHTSKNNRLLVRLFYKSSNPAYESLLQQSNEELKRAALQDIKNSLGITEEPIYYNVTKWHETMPNYHIKHHQLVESLESKMATRFPHVLLAGCSYYGVGIPDCIANGKKTAERFCSIF